MNKKITGRLAGRFYQQLMLIGKWIQTRKKFIYIAPNYIVVGLSEKEYKKHFPQKQAKKREPFIIFDEVSEINNKARLNQ